MTTHRAIQIHNLKGECSSRSRVLRRGAANLERIGNRKGAACQVAKAVKCDRIAAECRRRLAPPRRPRPTDPENNGPRPECADECNYRQKYTGYALQRNALRMELASMVHPYRCGWNIKPGRIGGDPLDYEACYHNN
jgi:hypothetical protein